MKLLKRKLGIGFGPRAQAREYAKTISQPFHQMFTVLLRRALELKADAICFGFRPEMVEDPQGQEIRSQGRAQFSKWLAEQREIYPSRMAALDHSALTRGPEGETGIPISTRISGVLRYFGEQPFHSYGHLMGAIEFRPVAIGADEDHPQPLRYAEIGYGMSKDPVHSGPNGKRRFVEIDLEYQKDNTFWVYLQGEREIEAGVRVSRTIF